MQKHIISKTGLAAGALASLLFCAGAQSGDPVHQVEKSLMTPLGSSSKVLQALDSHSGFHGDGMNWIVLELDAQDLEALRSDAAQTGSGWHTLPLSETAETVFYGSERMENGIVCTQSPSVPDGTELPPVNNGCWMLIDWQEGKPDAIFDESRHSENFTAALADFDRKRLYFLDIDT